MASLPNSRRAEVVIAGAVLVLAFLVCRGLTARFFAWSDETGRQDQAATEDYVEGLKRGVKLAVPPGADRKVAEAWLAAQGLTVTEWEPDCGDSAIEGHGILPQRLARILRGETQQALHWSVNDVRVYFFLDKQGKVIQHQVYCINYSL